MELERDDDSKKRHHALAPKPRNPRAELAIFDCVGGFRVRSTHSTVHRRSANHWPEHTPLPTPFQTPEPPVRDSRPVPSAKLRPDATRTRTAPLGATRP